MRAMIGLEGGYHVAVNMPINLRREIQEGLAQAIVRTRIEGLVASATGWGG